MGNNMTTISDILRMLCSIILRGRLLSTDDTHSTQVAKLEIYNQQFRDLPRMQDYGVSSHPPKGSEAVVGFSDPESQTKGFVLTMNHPDSRPINLPEGAVTLHNNRGTRITLNGNTATVDAEEVFMNVDHVHWGKGATRRGRFRKVIWDIED